MASCEHPSQACEATRRRVVLVVEDEALVRLTIADYLRDGGYAVAEAADANEAREIFASGEPVDGLMFVRWVDEHYPGIQVLVTSGKGDAALSSGLIPDHAFFSKPYALEEVASRIHSLLS
jgi:DNA-binding response OmpR family regulator